MSAPTAILLFARSAGEEARQKALPLGIAAQLLRRARRTCTGSGLPVYEIDERAQEGDTFGSRLSRAVAETFACGHECLLIVGSDCPFLTKGQLRAAARFLNTGRALLGRDHRGGAYLIGLHRRQFSATAFAALPWCTDRLADALTLALGSSRELPARADINSFSDTLQYATAAGLSVAGPQGQGGRMHEGGLHTHQLPGRGPPLG